MPIFDKPLPELYQYKGTNPKPADFDTYWDSSIAEMKAIDPTQIELVPNHFIKSKHVECFNLYFTGVGGAKVHAMYLRPKNAPKGKLPAVLQFHGYSGNAGDWHSKLGFVAEGFSYLALDCRGQSGLSQDTTQTVGNTFKGQIIRGLADEDPKKLLFRQIFLDTAQLANIAFHLPEVDATRVGAWGGSQGGGLTLACVSLETRIKFAAPIFPFLSDYRRVWDMDLAKDAYAELRDYLRWYDPRHERVNEMFTKLGYIDVQHLAPRIKSKIMMATGLMDTICPPSSQFAAYNKITAPKELKIYPDFGHENLPEFNDMVFNLMMGL